MENKDEVGMLCLLLGHTRSWSLQALQCEAPVLRNPPAQSYLQSRVQCIPKPQEAQLR